MADIRIVRLSSQSKVSVKNGKVQIKIKITGEGGIEGTQCSDSLDSMSITKKYEKKAEDYFKKQLLSTIQTAQTEFKSDIFGFGETLYRQHPEQFKKRQNNWSEAFSEADVDVEAIIKIRRNGLRNQSYISEMEKEIK